MGLLRAAAWGRGVAARSPRGVGVGCGGQVCGQPGAPSGAMTGRSLVGGGSLSCPRRSKPHQELTGCPLDEDRKEAEPSAPDSKMPVG